MADSKNLLIKISLDGKDFITQNNLPGSKTNNSIARLFLTVIKLTRPFILILAAILFTGCMDTYNLKTSKDPGQFLGDLNKKVNDRSVNVILTTGATIDAKNLEINRDSASYITLVEETNSGKRIAVAKSEIESIEYQSLGIGQSGFEALITLKSGREIQAENLFSTQDSLFINNQRALPSLAYKKITLPASNIRRIEFNDHWAGLAEGAGAFFLASAIAGYEIAGAKGGDQESLPPEFTAIVLGLAGGIAGIIPGVVFGSEQEFIINEPPVDYKGLTSFGLRGGMNIAAITSSNYNPTDIFGSNYDYSYGLFAEWSFNNDYALRGEVFKSFMGGNFTRRFDAENYYQIQTLYLAFIQAQVQWQYTVRSIYFNPRFYAGPSLSFFITGRLNSASSDKYHYKANYDKSIKPSQIHSPFIGINFGAGINLQRHVTMDIQYNLGLSSVGNNLYDGLSSSLRQNVFSIMMGYGF